MALVFRRGFNLPSALAQIGRIDSGGSPNVTTYPADPYNTKNRNTGADFALIAATGVDFVRVFVDPGPVLASTAFSAAEMGNLMISVARRLLAAGLNVVFTFSTDVVGSFNATAVQNSSALQTAFLSMLASIVSKFKNDSLSYNVAIELWNEPQFYGSEAVYLALITAWYTALRPIDANRVLILGPCRGYGLNALSLFMPTPAMINDLLLMFTVHDYGKNNPANNGYPSYAFAFQGLTYGTDWIADMRTPLKWHPTVGLTTGQIATARAAAIAAAQATARAGTNLTALATEIGSYFDTPATPDVLTGRGELGAFTVWAAQYGISLSRLFLGEFGPYRYADPTRGGVQPADAVDYVHDFRVAAETLGIGWCYFAYDAWDGTPNQLGLAGFSCKLAGTTTGQLDPALCGPNGLGLRV